MMKASLRTCSLVLALLSLGITGAMAKDKRFDITYSWKNVWGRDRWDYFYPAAKRWSWIIRENLPTRNVDPILQKAPTACGGYPESINDVFICVNYRDIDGPGGVLGASGPTLARSELGFRPYAGVIFLDQADVPALRHGSVEINIDLKTYALHELTHVLGFTNYVLARSNTTGLREDDCPYFGENGKAMWQEMTGCPAPDAAPPMETDFPGDFNLQCNHWSERCMAGELMSTYGQVDENPALSKMTIAAMQDVGYKVRYDLADPFDINPDCICDPERRLQAQDFTSKNKAGRRARRKLSKEGMDAATTWGKDYLASQKLNTTSADYVGDQAIHVLYHEEGEIYGVHVTL